LIDSPLASNWRYDLGSRKIFEFRSALGLDGEGPAPAGAVFAYAIVPGLARMLTEPRVVAHRNELRMSRVEVVFSSALDMRGELVNAIEVEVGDSVVGVISSRDPRGARAVATLHLTSDLDYEPSIPVDEGRPVARLQLDPARCVAFAAATWDLNPSYWDRDFAEAAGLGDLVVPPGLPVALAVEELERASGRHSSALDVRFDRAARPGDRLELRTNGGPSPDDLFFEAESQDGLVLSGRAMLGHQGPSSVTS
jgi:acyl dehydratase